MDGKSFVSLAAGIYHPFVYHVRGSVLGVHTPLELCAAEGRTLLVYLGEKTSISLGTGRTSSLREEVVEKIFLARGAVRNGHNPSVFPAPFPGGILACRTGCPIFLAVRNPCQRPLSLAKTTWSFTEIS